MVTSSQLEVEMAGKFYTNHSGNYKYSLISGHFMILKVLKIKIISSQYVLHFTKFQYVQYYSKFAGLCHMP